MILAKLRKTLSNLILGAYVHLQFIFYPLNWNLAADMKSLRESGEVSLTPKWRNNGPVGLLANIRDLKKGFCEAI